MANGKTLTERMTVIETKFETVIEPMAFKVDQIHDSLPELKRKVDAHHCVFPDHVETIERLKKKVLPEKRESDGNGGFKERRTKKSLWVQFKELPLPKRLSILVIGFPFIGGYWDWLLNTFEKLINWLQAVT